MPRHRSSVLFHNPGSGRAKDGTRNRKCQRNAALSNTDRPRRLAELDSKLTHLLGLLSQPKGPPSLHESQSVSSSGLSVSADCVEVEPSQSQTPARWIAHEPLPDLDLDLTGMLNTEYSLDTVPTQSTNIDNAWITNLGLSDAVLQHLLDNFRGMDYYFPFVIIPASWTPTSMAEDRPFLLLAAVTSAASMYHYLQQALIDELKEVLSRRVVMAGEKDLDLLQGLLVHLAWLVSRVISLYDRN